MADTDRENLLKMSSPEKSLEVNFEDPSSYPEFKHALSLMERKDKRHRITTILFMLCFVIVSSAAVFLYIFFNKEIGTLQTTQKYQFEKHLETNQFLLSTLDWSSKRAHTILFMRDQVVKEWKRCGEKILLEKAYKIAERNMIECEKYPHLDPLFLLSMQHVESAFNERAISKMGACGLNQLMPSTAKLLCGFFNIQCADSLLFDIAVSTMFAAKLIDVLYAQYKGNIELILADYNGGPWQAYYFREDRKKLAEETSKYVPEVMRVYKEYTKLFKSYKIDKTLISR